MGNKNKQSKVTPKKWTRAECEDQRTFKLDRRHISH